MFGVGGLALFPVDGDNCLLAVNTGSDTVTSFAIQAYGLQNDCVVSSGGDLPVYNRRSSMKLKKK